MEVGRAAAFVLANVVLASNADTSHKRWEMKVGVALIKLRRA